MRRHADLAGFRRVDDERRVRQRLLGYADLGREELRGEAEREGSERGTDSHDRNSGNGAQKDSRFACRP